MEPAVDGDWVRFEDVQRVLDAFKEESLDDIIEQYQFDAAQSVKIAEEIKRLESWPPQSWPSMNDRRIYAALLARAQQAEAELAALRLVSQP